LNILLLIAITMQIRSKLVEMHLNFPPLLPPMASFRPRLTLEKAKNLLLLRLSPSLRQKPALS
jgi:hypothetical protein